MIDKDKAMDDRIGKEVMDRIRERGKQLLEQHEELTKNMRRPTEADYERIEISSLRLYMEDCGWQQLAEYGTIGTIWEHPEYGREHQILLPNDVLCDHAMSMYRVVDTIANAYGVIRNKIICNIYKTEIFHEMEPLRHAANHEMLKDE